MREWVAGKRQSECQSLSQDVLLPTVDCLSFSASFCFLLPMLFYTLFSFSLFLYPVATFSLSLQGSFVSISRDLTDFASSQWRMDWRWIRSHCISHASHFARRRSCSRANKRWISSLNLSFFVSVSHFSLSSCISFFPFSRRFCRSGRAHRTDKPWHLPQWWFWLFSFPLLFSHSKLSLSSSVISPCLSFLETSYFSSFDYPIFLCSVIVELDDTDLLMFQALPHLQILRLKECPIMQTNCRLSCLRPLSPTLTSLNLSECDIDDEAITDLAYLTQLTWLHLKRSPDLAAAGAISLLALTNLRHLNLEGCISIDDQAVTLLSDSLHALTSLDIQNSQVSDRGVAALARGCSQLQEINLLGCPITSDSFPIFASWERLNRLDLSSSNENAFSHHRTRRVRNAKQQQQSGSESPSWLEWQ